MDYEYKNHEGDMILRDYLAYDRTKFALLRTFLSIERTALGLLASGAGLVILQTSATLVSAQFANRVSARTVGLVTGVVLVVCGGALIAIKYLLM